MLRTELTDELSHIPQFGGTFVMSSSREWMVGTLRKICYHDHLHTRVQFWSDTQYELPMVASSLRAIDKMLRRFSHFSSRSLGDLKWHVNIELRIYVYIWTRDQNCVFPIHFVYFLRQHEDQMKCALNSTIETGWDRASTRLYCLGRLCIYSGGETKPINITKFVSSAAATLRISGLCQDL